MAPTVGIFPSPFGESQWDKTGNGHFRIVRQLIEEHGWTVRALTADQVLTADCDHVDAVHVNWTELLALATVRRRSIGLWARLSALRSSPQPDRILRRIARSALRPIARRRPLVYQIHDLDSNWLQPRATWLVDRAIKAACLDLAAGWVVHERSCLRNVPARHRPPPHICVSPLGDYATFHGPCISREEARARLSLPQKGTIFLFSGYSSARRNPVSAAAAMARIPSGAATLVVASSNGHDYLTGPPGENIRLTSGFLKPEMVRDLCCAADWILMPGQNYLTSAVVRTALSYCRPVICPKFGCQADMARDAAIWLADDSEQSVFAALQAALQMPQPEYGAHCAAAEQRHRERTWTGSVASYIQMLNTLSGAQSSHRNWTAVPS